MSKILIVEDNIIFREIVCSQLNKQGWDVLETSTVSEAKKLLKSEAIDLVISDVRLPDGDGIELLEWIKKQNITLPPYIIATDYGQIPAAVHAVKLGAEDYLCKPPDMDRLLLCIKNLLSKKSASAPRKQKVMYQRQSKLFKEAEKEARDVALADISVLIRGSNGTGKEYIARLVHQESLRKDQPFVAVDCGVLSRELAASDLFGHRKGAFTGATEKHIGYFRQADGGTLFLDEIGNLSLDIQVMLLRAIQEYTYRPVGEEREVTADIRIIAATNEDLEKAIAEKRFREDLYHRLNEFDIRVPNLSECPEDIRPFADFFLEKCCKKAHKEVSGFDKEALKALYSYHWPGNVREMENRILRAVVKLNGDIIRKEDLALPESNVPKANILTLKDENEIRKCLIEALDAADGNKKLAADLLGISRSTLHEKLKRYNIESWK